MNVQFVSFFEIRGTFWFPHDDHPHLLSPHFWSIILLREPLTQNWIQDPYSSKEMGHRLQQDEIRRGKVMLINLVARLRVLKCNRKDAQWGKNIWEAMRSSIFCLDFSTSIFPYLFALSTVIVLFKLIIYFAEQMYLLLLFASYLTWSRFSWFLVMSPQSQN